MGGGYTLNMASVEAAPEPPSPQVGVAVQLQSSSCRGCASSTRGAACHCLPSHWGDVCCSCCCSTLPEVRIAPLMGRGNGLRSFRRARQVSERERSTACVGYLPASQQEGFSAAEVVCWAHPTPCWDEQPAALGPARTCCCRRHWGRRPPRAPDACRYLCARCTALLPAIRLRLCLLLPPRSSWQAGAASATPLWRLLTAAPCPACAAASLPAAGAGARFAPYSPGERLPDCGNCLHSCSGHLQQMRCPARFSQVAQQACCPIVHPSLQRSPA
jgi:hypothetical protein